MTIDVNFASLLGALMLLMISIIGYFLKAIMGKLNDMEKAKNQTALDIERLKAEVHQVAEGNNDRLGRLEDRAKDRDKEREIFWRDLPARLRDALRPDFEALIMRVNRIEEGK